MGAEIIEAGSVELPADNSTLLGVTDPAQGLAALEQFARDLKQHVGDRAHRIGNQEYLGIEALTVAATPLGIVGVVEEVRELENGWQATAAARTLDGRVVGRGVSVCTKDEPRWARKASFELLGMAQTRALSRALRGPVGSVVSLASYAVTPAEEAPTEPEPAPLPGWAQPTPDVAAAAVALVAILKAADEPDPAKRMAQLGRRIRERCDGQIPVGVLEVLEDIAAAVQPDEPSP